MFPLENKLSGKERLTGKSITRVLPHREARGGGGLCNVGEGATNINRR